jgi:hypothetical protein
MDNTKYYELIIMPINALQTGFNNINDPILKLIAFPAPNAEHIFSTKIWKEQAFTLDKLYLVTARPQ